MQSDYDSKEEIIEKGSTCLFGSYLQSKDTPEPIEWDVLDVVDNKAFLFATKILDAHCYYSNTKDHLFKHPNNYANSDIRKWLNNEFYNKAFNKEEKERILVTEVDNSEKSTYPYTLTIKNIFDNKYACENTKDKIFILSQYEITNYQYGFSKDYFNKDINRKKQVTEYSKKNGASFNDDFDFLEGNGRYFLRSPSFTKYYCAAYVDYEGIVRPEISISSTSIGVVPALWIKI